MLSQTDDAYFLSKMMKYGIPAHCQAGLLRYITMRCPVGSFLTHVLENNFVGAVGYADDTNINSLRSYAMFLRWAAPDDCWGSREKVKAWLNPKKGKDEKNG